MVEFVSDTKNQGEFYYIEVRPIAEYKAFRTREVDDKDGIERVGGQRADGSWDTVKWLVSKELAHLENGRLAADHSDVKELFEKFDSEPKHIAGNRFEAQERAAE